MSNLKACGALDLAEEGAHPSEKNQQANFNSQQSLTPVFFDQNSSISAIKKLHKIATKLGNDCYHQKKSSTEIVREFLNDLERLRRECR